VNGGSALDADFQDAGGGDGTIFENELQVTARADEAGLEHAGLIGGALQGAGHGRGTEIGVAGDADTSSAHALDAVAAVPGFDVQRRAGRQALAIDVFGGRHMQSLLSDYDAFREAPAADLYRPPWKFRFTCVCVSMGVPLRTAGL
jgi:hypothetical protein